MKHCENCNLYYEDEAKWCSNCGAPLTEQPAAAEQPAPETPAPEQQTNYIPYTPPVPQAEYTGSADSAPQSAYAAPQTEPAGGSTTLWLVLSIVATAMCCWPFGIPAILAAAAAKKAEGVGDILLRNEKVKKARMWFIISAAVGVVFWVVYCIVVASAAVQGNLF